MRQRFLISRLSALGDVTCSLPAAVALRRAYPDCEIVWAVDPRFAGIVECCEAVSQVTRCAPGLKPNSWRVTSGRFDAAFDLQGLLKSALVLGGANASRKLGYHWQREGAWLFSDRVLPDPTSFHIVDQYLDVVRAFGVEADRAGFGLKPLAEDEAAIRALLEESDVDPGRLVVLNAGAGWASKRWPAPRFATLANILKEVGLSCVFVGSKSRADADAFEEVRSAGVEQAANLLGRTSVRQLVALISVARAHIGGDTGSTHIAAALGVPAFGLYGITNPRRSCPYGQIDRCFYDPKDMDAIRPNEVAERVIREAA